MKWFNSLVLFLVVLFCLDNVETIKAVDIDETGKGGTDNTYGSCPTCKHTFSPTGYGYGIRISLIDENGKRISGTHSFDIISQTPSSAYSVSSKPTRYEVVDMNGQVSFSAGYTGTVKSDLPQFIDVGNGSYVKISDYIKNTYLVDSKGNVDLLKLDDFLEMMGSNYKQYEKECKGSLIYLAIEPIVVIKNHDENVYYVGTASELANWRYYDNNAISGVGTIFTKGTMPLSLYLDEDIAGAKAVSYYTLNNNIFSEMNNKSGGAVLGYGLYIFKLSDVLTCDDPTPPTPPKTDICDFSLDIKIPDNCSTGTSGYIKDIDNWDCIYSSTLASSINSGNSLSEYEKIANHFFEWENSYCAVYCREWIEYDFPNNSMTVLAGTHFILGNQYVPNGPTNFTLPRLNPIRFIGRSECRVTQSKSDKVNTTINIEQFKEDYADKNATVKTTWDNWQIALKKDNAVTNSTNASASNDCNLTCDGWTTYDCKKNGEIVKNGCQRCSGGWTNKNHKKNPAKVTYNSGDGDKDVTPGQYCDNDTPKYVTNQKSLYDNAVSARDNVLKQIKDCNNFVRKNDIFQPELDFNYEEPIYGKSVNGLDYTLNTNIQTNYYLSNNKLTSTVRKESVFFNNYTGLSQNSDFVTTSDNNGKTAVIDKYVCDTKGSTCKKSSESYPTNNWLRQWTTKTYEYKLPTGIYSNITRTSGESYNYASEVDSTKNSVPISYSNLPIHYSTKSGTYDYQIRFNSFGTKSSTEQHKFNYYIFENGKIGQTYGEYFDVYYLMLNLPNLKSKLAHCNQADHLGHGLATQLKSEGLINDFLNSTCAVQHHCYSDGYNIICTYYKDTFGNWRSYSPGWQTPASYTTYNQVVSCIQQYAIKLEGRDAFDGKTTYDCTYNVQNNIIITKDLNIIFRTISLDNPFPGKSGNSRTPGANWNRYNLVNTYITNNRNVETEKVYKELDPLYTITLTPALIKEIRKYNDEVSGLETSYYATRKPLTGSIGYADFNLNCEADGKKCKSNFIRNVVNSFSFSKYFSGCGIKNKETGLKCKTNDAW